MKDKFVYVFDDETKETLLSLGFTLIQDDPRQSVYIFELNDNLNFNMSDYKCATSNVLTL